MTLTRSETINIIDELAEVRDLATVCLMASETIGDRDARNGLSRLLGQICSQMDTIGEKLTAAHKGNGDDPA